MKKCLLFMIVLFTIGQMCKAQGNQLLSGNVLKQTTETRQMQVNRAPAHAPEGAVQYWVDAMAHFNEYGTFDASQLSPASSQATVTFDGDEVTIQGLVNIDRFQIVSENAVTGHYDAEARTITISTPGYDSEMSLDDYTTIGTIKYMGDDVKLMLFAGNFSAEPDANGNYGLETVDELVFDVSEDFATITARTGYGSYGFRIWNGSQAGFLNFYKTATLIQRPEAAMLVAKPAEIVLDGPTVTVGASVPTTIKVNNIGLTEANIYAVREDNTVDVTASGSKIAAGATLDVQVVLHPTVVGDYTTNVHFYTQNQSSHTVTHITAHVGEAPDFSAIVKEGDIAFSMTADKPFVMSEEILDVPVAVSSNENDSYGRSSLVANVFVPEGKTGILSWKGMNEAPHPNGGTNIFLDGTQIYNNVYEHNAEGFLDLPIDNALVLEPGNHTVRFDNVINMNSYLSGYVDRPFRTYIYDMSMVVDDVKANAAVLKTQSVNFGRSYVDKLPCHAQAEVTLVNAGTNPLRVTGFSEGMFSGVVTDDAAEFGQELKVIVTFETAEVGEHNGQVVISTTAGDFTVDCLGVTEALPTDYSPIVEEGEFSFNTSFDYPFIVEENEAYSSTAYIVPTSGKINSWLEAEFVVPDGCEGYLSWEGLNSSEDWFNFMGSLSFNDGTRITIDDSLVKEFCGEVDAGSGNFEDEQLTFAPGRHKVRFDYEKMLRNPKGDDRFVLSYLSLVLTGNSAVDAMASEAQVVRTEVYSVSGHRLNGLQPGINLVRETLSDGTQRTRKIVK